MTSTARSHPTRSPTYFIVVACGICLRHVGLKAWHTTAASTRPALALRVLVGLLAGVALVTARAQSPSAPVQPVPSSRWSQEAAAAWGEAQAAVAARDWVQAELLLERTLMLAPEHAEALLQLAFVLVQRGRDESARGLVAALQSDPRTPPAHRARLAELRAAIDAITVTRAAVLTTRAPSTTLQLSLGASSNPLALTSARELRLTTTGGDVVLPLARTPAAGRLWGLDLGHRTAGGVELYAQARRSIATEAHDAWRLSLALPLAAPATPPGTSVVSTAVMQLSAQRTYDGGQRQAALLTRTCIGPFSTAASVPSVATACGVGLFEESTGRRGLLARAALAHNTPLLGRAPIQTLFWTEYEVVRHSSQPDALRLGAQARWSPSSALELQALWLWQGDRQGYSPLLADGAPRRLHTAQLLAQWRIPADLAGGEFHLQVGVARRWANIPLFSWQEASVQILWQRVWSR